MRLIVNVVYIVVYIYIFVICYVFFYEKEFYGFIGIVKILGELEVVVVIVFYLTVKYMDINMYIS